MDTNFYLAVETKPNNYFPINLLDLNISKGFASFKIAELDKFTLKFTKKEIIESIKEANLLELNSQMELIVIYHEKNVVRTAPVLTKDISFDMWAQIKDNYQNREYINKIYNFLKGKTKDDNLIKLKKVQELADLVNIIESLPYFTTRKLYFYLYEN